MKKVLFMLVAMATVATLAAKEKKRETVTMKVNLHCDKCVNKIESSIPFEKGVKDLDVNLEKECVSVTYDPAKTDSTKIAKAITKLDFKVE